MKEFPLSIYRNFFRFFVVFICLILFIVLIINYLKLFFLLKYFSAFLPIRDIVLPFWAVWVSFWGFWFPVFTGVCLPAGRQC